LEQKRREPGHSCAWTSADPTGVVTAPSFPSEKVFNELAGKTIRQAQSQRPKSLYTIAIQSGSLSFPSSRTVDTGVDSLMNLQRCDVVLPNDDQTPMEFVVFVCADASPALTRSTKETIDHTVFGSHFPDLWVLFPRNQAKSKRREICSRSRLVRSLVGFQSRRLRLDSQPRFSV
jgi:hypothetical protein